MIIIRTLLFFGILAISFQSLAQETYITTGYYNYATHTFVKIEQNVLLDHVGKKLHLPKPYELTYDIKEDIDVPESLKKTGSYWVVYSNGKYVGLAQFDQINKEIEINIDGFNTLYYKYTSNHE